MKMALFDVGNRCGVGCDLVNDCITRGGNLRICLLQCCPWLQAPHDGEPPRMKTSLGHAARTVEDRFQGQRSENIRSLQWIRSYKPFRHDAHNSENGVV